MHQKLDFSLLVLTSFLVVLALEPVQHMPSPQAAVREFSSPKSLELAASDRANLNPEGQIFAGAEERTLRLLESKFSEM